MKRFVIAGTAASLAWTAGAQAALIVNSAQPITDQINVNLINVAADNGTGALTPFGNSTQQAAIVAAVNTIYAQAGVQVSFSFHAGTYNSTFALSGTPGSNNPRPGTDLNSIVSNATTAGVLSSNPNTINAFIVQIVPGFSQTSDNTSNGLAFVGGNGLAYYGGSNLAGFADGRDLLAYVLAHEIGHNLGLPHIGDTENLMLEGGSASPGQRLNSSQIATIIASPFTVAVPEPMSIASLGCALLLAGRRRSLKHRVRH